MKKLRLFLYGDDWVGHLAKILNAHPAHGIIAEYCEYPEIRPWKIFPKALNADILMRVGVRPGCKGRRLFFLDCIWWIFQTFVRSKQTIYYWIGTDVLDLKRERSENKYMRFSGASQRARNFSNAPWLATELTDLGVVNELVLFPVGKVSPPESSRIRWPSHFTVLAYIPDGRSEFYGGDTLVEAALQFPEIRFQVVGGIGSWLESIPPNMEFLGFVQDMDTILNNVHVVVRQVEHDAIGGTVREGLFFARHIVYSYPLPHTSYAPWSDKKHLCQILSDWHRAFLMGQLEPNWDGRFYAINAWDPEVLLENFVGAMKAPSRTHQSGG